MTYCSVSDIKNELGNDTLTYCLYDPETIDFSDLDAKIQSVIDKTDGIIDGFLEGRYTLPLSFTPRLLKPLSMDICKYHILAKRGLDEKNSSDKSVIEQHKMAMRILEKIATGLITLKPSSVPAPDRNVGMEVESSERIFSRDSLKGM